MAETQAVKELKFKITTLQHQLARKDKQLEEYQTVESEADSKIKALNKMHGDKVKNLLNSMQILKKEKASLEGQSKQHKRSKLIEQLNKEIGDQDIVIEVLRKVSYDREGKERGRAVCDDLIVKALTKGPERIRPLSREELRMEIDRLKSINLSLEGKMKNQGRGPQNRNSRAVDGDELSEISSVSDKSFVNQDEEVLKKLRDLQYENQNGKLEVNAKLKIIERLKTDLKEQDKVKIQLEVFKNQLDVANRKVSTYERLMKESKESTNTKIIELYEREIKVEELEMVSRENRDKLSQAQEGHNILVEEMKLEKEQIEEELNSLKGENEQLILDNIAAKKRLDESKRFMKDMDEINGKNKEKLNSAETEIQRIVAENKKFKEGYHNIEGTLFTERAQWVDEKTKLMEEVREVRENTSSKELIGKYMQDISDLKEENERLKQMLDAGGSHGDDKILIERLENYKRKIEFYESKGDKETQRTYYDELFNKYHQLAEDFQQYKKRHGDRDSHKHKKDHRAQVIQITKKEESEYENLSSGISRLGLEDVGSDILDNFDSSYEYEFVVNELGDRVKMPKMSKADKELLKLITSEVWDFAGDDKMEKKISDAAAFYGEDSDDEDGVRIDYEKVRQIKNLNHPRGIKIIMYEKEVEKLKDLSDSISITSALDKQLNQYDSDVNIEMKRMPKGAAPHKLNTFGLNQVSMSVDGLSDISSARQGESNLGKKKKKQDVKASTLAIKKKEKTQVNDSDIEKSSIGSSLLDSDVSSVGIKEEELALMDSDIEPNFRKEKQK